MQHGAGVVGAREAAGAEAYGRHPEVAPVLLHHQVRRGLRDAEQRVGRGVDAHRRVDPAVVGVRRRELEPRFVLDERQPVRRVPVDLVRRGEHEACVRSVPTRGLEQIERAVRVHAEVHLGSRGRPVVRGLRGCVHDQLDLAAVAGEDAVDPVGVADIEVERGELGVYLEEAFGHRAGRRRGAEELAAHVVLDPDDVVAGLDEVPHRFGADQPSGACDDRNGHRRVTPAWPARRARCPRPRRACPRARCAAGAAGASS